MILAVDTNALYTTRAGVARYIRGLLGGLDQVAPPGLRVHPFAWPVENFAFRQPHRAWRTFYREFIWAGLLARGQLRRLGAGVLHSTGAPLFVPPRGVRHVVTIHDIGFLRFPERFRPWHRRMAIRALERSRSAEALVAISQYTADELMRLAGIPARQITVVHNGCSLGPDAPEAPLTSPRPPEEFFLFVGSLEPGKNLRLLRAMYELAAATGTQLPPLLIVGARFEGLAGEGAPPAGWHYLGHQPDTVLVWLYRRARALLFPSIYEGFGLPIAEAMTLGCPVICSPVSSLPEVGGSAALYAELSPESYLAQCRRLLEEPGLREECIDAGRTQGARFTWTACAARMLEVYSASTR